MPLALPAHLACPCRHCAPAVLLLHRLGCPQGPCPLTATPTPSHTHTHCPAGFIAKNAQGQVTTLKRNGSDYSATIIGALFQARRPKVGAGVAAAHRPCLVYLTASACAPLPDRRPQLGAAWRPLPQLHLLGRCAGRLPERLLPATRLSRPRGCLYRSPLAPALQTWLRRLSLPAAPSCRRSASTTPAVWPHHHLDRRGRRVLCRSPQGPRVGLPQAAQVRVWMWVCGRDGERQGSAHATRAGGLRGRVCVRGCSGSGLQHEAGAARRRMPFAA